MIQEIQNTNKYKLNTKKTLVLVMILWAMIITFLRTIRLPNDFSEAHWLIDYRYGFIKRGFIGSCLTLLETLGLHVQSLFGIITFSTISFGLFVVIIFLMSRNILERYEWSNVLVFLIVVFVTSPFMTMSGHLFGYFDNVFFTLIIISVWFVVYNKVWIGICILSISILVHESSLLIGYPLILLALQVRNSKSTTKTSVSVKDVILLLLPAISFSLVLMFELMIIDVVFLREKLYIRLSQFSFIQDNRAVLVPEWLTSGFVANLNLNTPKMFERLSGWDSLVTIPSTLMLILFFRFGKQKNIKILLIAIGAILSPYLIHFVAWDTCRISTYSIMVGFICVWLCGKTAESEVFKNSGQILFLVFLYIVVIFNIFSIVPLMDWEVDRFTSLTRLVLYAPVWIGMLFLFPMPHLYAKFKTNQG